MAGLLRVARGTGVLTLRQRSEPYNKYIRNVGPESPICAGRVSSMGGYVVCDIYCGVLELSMSCLSLRKKASEVARHGSLSAFPVNLKHTDPSEGL